MKFIAISLITSLSLSLCLCPISVWADSGTLLKQLKRERDSDRILIERARECVPKKTEKGILLCTGGNIADSDWFLHLDQKSCTDEIKKRGYSVADDNHELRLTSEQYESFVSSTKRAETFHDSKTVVFKKPVADRIDCLHELVHVLQWTTGGSSPLSPPNRKKHGEKLADQLEQVASDVEALERRGKKSEALKLAEDLKPYIAHLEQWNMMADWLDEKDAHYLIFDNCDSLNCTLTDRDVAIANLIKRLNYLPEALREPLKAAGEKVLEELKSEPPAKK